MNRRRLDAEGVRDAMLAASGELNSKMDGPGVMAPIEKEIEDLIPRGFKDPHTGEKEFEKTFDILDVWFDSGVSCQAVVKDMIKDELPTDL